MLWDCGHSKGGRPSVFLPNRGISSIQNLVITSFDENRISDLLELRSSIDISALIKNPGISAQELRRLKEAAGPVSAAMESMLEMMGSHTEYAFSPLDFPDVTLNMYHNNYGTGYGEFTDTNNLSLVSFLSFGSRKVIIPGDIERDGWLSLLKNPDFRNELCDVNVFVASHGGKVRGYCPEVFGCIKNEKVECVIFSSQFIEETTQVSSVYVYENHATGIMFDGGVRYVLTTRNDGTFWLAP
ncbi:hypothetical protein LJC19_05075 [Oxalobacter sp. OttesenSCG-928-P03]|nr:hypothetical protein [Oxalobacter sp. OttesenSCG-928-P03]